MDIRDCLLKKRRSIVVVVWFQTAEILTLIKEVIVEMDGIGFTTITNGYVISNINIHFY